MTEMVGKRLVGYIRVSTDQQAEDGNSLTFQRQAIETWAFRNHIALVGIFSDEGVSGGEAIDKRHGMPLALSACTGAHRDGDAGAIADGVVVYRLDRLARDMILQEWFIKELSRHGAQLYSCQQVEQEMLADPDDPQRTMMRQIIGAFAQYESQMIRARLMAGKRVKAAARGYIGGNTPYGTSPGPHRDVVPNEAEIACLERMVVIRSEGVGYKKVATRLVEEGFTARNGKPWSAESVRQILKRVAPALCETNGPDHIKHPNRFGRTAEAKRKLARERRAAKKAAEKDPAA